MRILVVAPQPFFTPRGTPFSVYHRTATAAKLGAEIDLLTYGIGEEVRIEGVRTIRIPSVPFIPSVKVGPSYPKVLLDGLLLIWMVRLLIRNRYDVVHAHEESVFFARFLKPLFGFKLVYDMHSSLPQQLENFRFTSSRVLIGLFETLENSSLRSSDAVITICPQLAEYALPLLDDPRRHFLIENSIFDPVELATPAAAEEDPSLEDAVPPGRPLVLYAGTFEPYQGIDLLLRAFALCTKRIPEAFLLLFGGLPEQVVRFRTMAEELGIEADCHFAGLVGQEVVRRYAARASVTTSPRLHGDNTPLKIYEQLAGGVPLVATRIHAHTQVLNDEVCFLVDPEPAAFARGLVAALEEPSARDRRVAGAARLYAEKYSRDAYEQKMRALFDTLS